MVHRDERSETTPTQASLQYPTQSVALPKYQVLFPMEISWSNKQQVEYVYPLYALDFFGHIAPEN